jgi:hypothetical protein
MNRSFLIVAALVLLSSSLFGQDAKVRPTSAEHDRMKEDFASLLKSAYGYSNAKFQSNISSVEYPGRCTIEISVLEKSNYQPWRELSFREKTDVVRPLGVWWLSRTTRTISFDLSKINLNELRLDNGVVAKTMFLRVSLIDGASEISIQKKDVPGAETTERSKSVTLVVRDRSAELVMNELKELVAACSAD